MLSALWSPFRLPRHDFSSMHFCFPSCTTRPSIAKTTAVTERSLLDHFESFPYYVKASESQPECGRETRAFKYLRFQTVGNTAINEIKTPPVGDRRCLT